jgi:hypothetical protein
MLSRVWTAYLISGWCRVERLDWLSIKRLAAWFASAGGSERTSACRSIGWSASWCL